MANYVWIALPGQLMARLSALLTQLSRHGGRVVHSRLSRGQDQECDAHPTTMQTIERASAYYQEKLGFHTLFLTGEFRKMY